ncbi:MAG: hypothetical protein DI539_11720 [Flavobacterium psychrophilum]|nr:MAG: hypothetical protein DI539_11720 [Flavobacterium psychrophilum]
MKYTFLIVCFLFTAICSGQEQKKQFDLIISVDNDIIQTISNAQIVVKKGNGHNEIFNVSYYPGNLSLNHNDFDMLPEGENVIYFKFTYIKYSKDGEQDIRTYEIDMGKNWFDETYMIVKLYNTDKKQNKKLKPLEGKTYTFDLDYGRGQMIRIRNK